MTPISRFWGLQSLDAVPPAVAERLVDALYSQAATLAIGIAAMVMAGALAFLRTGATWLLIWTGLSAAVGAARLIQHRAYHHRRHTPGSLRLWARRFLVGSWIVGALWGSAAAIIVTAESDLFVVLLLLVVGTGYIVGGAVRCNAVPIVVLGQCALTLIPLLVACLAAPDPYMRLFAPFVALEIAAAVMITQFLSAMTRRLLLADAEKSNQLAQITKTQLELRRLTEELEVRVREEVAAREEALARAARAERLQALGQLAGGIAHDFNNVLQAVEGAAVLIDRRPDDQAGVRRLARVAIEAAGRGASITRRLLTFGRRGDLHAERLDVAGMLSSLHEILSHTLGATIDVHVRQGARLPPLLADKAQLETVLVNLATNARDAMPGGGRLTLSAETEVVSPDTPTHPAGLAPGRYVRLTVIDTGTGMDAVTLAHAGEPFFTTKGIGVGTGLGLPMAKGFAEQSGGALRIESHPGDGTTVTLWLQEADSDRSLTLAAPKESADPAPCWSLNATPSARLLLVDDEHLVREMLAEHLEDAGFGVKVAANGAEALALLAAGEAVDVLVTDLSMPGMDGLAVIRAAQEHRPELPAVLLTGYAGDGVALALGGAFTGGFSLLSKPVRIRDLTDRIRTLLATGKKAA